MSFPHFNWIDISIVIPLVISAFSGYKRGLAGAVIRLVGFLFALLLAVKNFAKFGKALSDSLPISADTAPYLAFFLILAGVVVLSRFVARLVTTSFDEAAVGPVNRLLGSVFSMFTSLVTISAMLILLAKADLPPEKFQNDSFLYPKVIGLAPQTYDRIVGVFPQSKNFYEEFNSMIEKSGVIQIDGKKTGLDLKK
jgi:membrane protein required for colicin V production